MVDYFGILIIQFCRLKLLFENNSELDAIIPQLNNEILIGEEPINDKVAFAVLIKKLTQEKDFESLEKIIRINKVCIDIFCFYWLN